MFSGRCTPIFLLCSLAADSSQVQFHQRMTVFYGDFTLSSRPFLQTARMSEAFEGRALGIARPTHHGSQQKERTPRMTNKAPLP